MGIQQINISYRGCSVTSCIDFFFHLISSGNPSMNYDSSVERRVQLSAFSLAQYRRCSNSQLFPNLEDL